MIRVCKEMWERGREELSALGVHPADWLYSWEQRIQRGDAVTFDCAILGWDWEDKETVSTAFQASADFDRRGRQITREMRREIPRLMKARGVKRCHVYSLCVTEDAEKWFRLLGFQPDPNYIGQKFGPYTMRRFWREA